jgi:hypothetical protein
MGNRATFAGSGADRGDRKAQGRAKVAAALTRLDEAIVDLCENDQAFREYLRLSGRMHQYSWGNRLLIRLQRPDTAMVAGFHRWRQLGRPVRKGSRGLQILAPMVVKQRADSDLAGYSTDRATVSADGTLDKVVGYRVAHVFAVEDTEGAPISRPQPIPEADDSEESSKIAERLALTAAALGLSVSVLRSDLRLGTGTNGRPAGWADLERRQIVINGDLPAAARAKTLAHEIAHQVAEHRLHNDDRRDAEAVAEGAAFVVAAHYGLDTSGYSAPYIASWAEDIQRVRRLLERISKVAATIIERGDELGSCAGCGWDGTTDAGGCLRCR